MEGILGGRIGADIGARRILCDSWSRKRERKKKRERGFMAASLGAAEAESARWASLDTTKPVLTDPTPH